MITHATSCQLLRNLKMLDEPSNLLSRNDNLKIILSNIRKNIADACSTNEHQYNLRARPINFEVDTGGYDSKMLGTFHAL